MLSLQEPKQSGTELHVYCSQRPAMRRRVRFPATKAILARAARTFNQLIDDLQISSSSEKEAATIVTFNGSESCSMQDRRW